MSLLMQALLLAALFADSVLTVTITLYDARMVGVPACEQDVLLTCPGIAKGDCCYVPNYDFTNVLFNGLPTTAIGVVYSDLMAYGCNGKVKESGAGLDLCLNGGTGAEWVDVNMRRLRRRKDSKPQSVLPSTFSIDGRDFDIFGEVPPEITQDMIEFFKNGTMRSNPRDIPEHFLPYEKPLKDEEQLEEAEKE